MDAFFSDFTYILSYPAGCGTRCIHPGLAAKGKSLRPLHWLIALFVLVPLVEIYLLVQIGGVVGAFRTVILVVATALLGATLVRAQGLVTLARLQAELQRGEIPAVAMLEGVMLLLAGALLLTPGFFTDAVGFLILVPSLRKRLIHWLLERLIASPGFHPPQRGSRTLDGEYRRED